MINVYQQITQIVSQIFANYNSVYQFLIIIFMFFVPLWWKKRQLTTKTQKFTKEIQREL